MLLGSKFGKVKLPSVLLQLELVSVKYVLNLRTDGDIFCKCACHLLLSHSCYKQQKRAANITWIIIIKKRDEN